MLRSFDSHTPELGERVYIDPAAEVLGQVRCGNDVSVWPMAVVRGDVNSIEIGDATNIQDGSVLHVTHDGRYSQGGIPLIVGREVTVGHKVILHACTIGDRCLVGMGAIVMDGAVLGDDIIVGAGSLVSPGKTLAPGHLYRGSPARRVRELTGDELEMLRYSAQHYVRLKNRYLAAG